MSKKIHAIKGNIDDWDIQTLFHSILEDDPDCAFILTVKDGNIHVSWFNLDIDERIDLLGRAVFREHLRREGYEVE